MKTILFLAFVAAAVVLGFPIGILMVEAICTTPVFGYCGGHNYAGFVYLGFWVAGSALSWLILRPIARRLISPRR